MSKYEPLQRYLEGLTQDEWLASFSDIERILGFGLPRSAHDYAAWRANERDPRSSHKGAWLDAGWRADEISLTARRVTFRRNNTRPLRTARKVEKSRAGSPELISVSTPEVETACTISLAWAPIGPVELDPGGKLAFPRASSSPGLYRFTLELAGRTTVYIGEADNLTRRFQHYRTPGSRQETNVRQRSYASGDQEWRADLRFGDRCYCKDQERPSRAPSGLLFKSRTGPLRACGSANEPCSGVVIANK